MPGTRNVHVGPYQRHTKTGKVVEVQQYTSIREAAETLMAAAGRPPVAARPAAQAATYPKGRNVPGVFPPKVAPPSQKRFAVKAEDARRMQGQTAGHFTHHVTGHAMGKTEIGDTYEQLFMAKFGSTIEKKYGKPELITGAGSGTARNTPLDFRTPTHGGELKTLNINSKNQKTAIKAEEIQRKLKAIEGENLKPLLLVQVVDQGSGTVHVYALETFASKAVSKMEHLGEYSYGTEDFQSAQEASGHASKAAGRAEAQRAAGTAGGDAGSGAVDRGRRSAPSAVGEQQPGTGSGGSAAGGPGKTDAGPPDAGQGSDQELTAQQTDAVKKYVTMQASPNNDLRAGKDGGDSAKQLDSAMRPSKKAMVVTRSLPASVVKDLKPGDTLADKGFLSTSSDPNFRPSYGVEGSTGPRLLSISVPVGTPAIDVDKTLGINYESEVILPRGSQLKVTKIDADGTVHAEYQRQRTGLTLDQVHAALKRQDKEKANAKQAQGSTEGRGTGQGAGKAPDVGAGGRGGQAPAQEHLTGEDVHADPGVRGFATDSEHMALEDYVALGYDPINQALRNGQDLLGTDEMNVGSLKDLIGRTRLSSPIEVYRGIHDDGFLKDLQVGSEITDRGFMSTTTLPKKAQMFGNTQVRIRVPAGAHALSVQTVLHDDDVAQREGEILFAPGSRLRVTSIGEQDGKRTVEADWLPPEKGGGVHSKLNEAKLSSLLIGLSNSTEDAWRAAAQTGIDHLTLVLKNNPAKTMAHVLQRPDVQEAIEHAGVTGAQAVMADIRATWEANGGDPDSPYLAALLRDAEHNGFMYAHRVTPVLLANDHAAARALMERDRIRASAAGAVAATRARTESSLAQMKTAGVKYVVWRAHIDDQTCSWCLSLDGAIADLGMQFPISGPTPYFDLTGPPRHPNCRCWLEEA